MGAITLKTKFNFVKSLVNKWMSVVVYNKADLEYFKYGVKFKKKCARSYFNDHRVDIIFILVYG